MEKVVNPLKEAVQQAVDALPTLLKEFRVPVPGLHLRDVLRSIVLEANHNLPEEKVSNLVRKYLRGVRSYGLFR